MSVWVRIKNLPLGLMNKHWGEELAKKIGIMEKIDVDAHGQAWGAYLRVKVKIDITKPLWRGVSIFSAKRQAKEWYEIQYEKLPMYRYSCGIIGHSSIECLTPAERDENGRLPYSVNLRVSDERKKKNFEELSGHSSSSPEKFCNVSSGQNTGSRDSGSQKLDDRSKNFDLTGQQNLEILNNASGQQRKRKQVRQSWEEERSDGSFDHTRDVEMSIVLARPVLEPSITHNDGDIYTEVEEQDSIKKPKMDSVNEKAGLLSQSRLEK